MEFSEPLGDSEKRVSIVNESNEKQISCPLPSVPYLLCSLANIVWSEARMGFSVFRVSPDPEESYHI